KHKITQRELAQKLNKRESEISKWLSGGHNFTQRTLTKISIAIGEPIYNIPSTEKQTNETADQLYTIKVIFSRIVSKDIINSGFKYSDYGSKEISALSVDSNGVICKSNPD